MHSSVHSLSLGASFATPIRVNLNFRIIPRCESPVSTKEREPWRCSRSPIYVTRNRTTPSHLGAARFRTDTRSPLWPNKKPQECGRPQRQSLKSRPMEERIDLAQHCPPLRSIKRSSRRFNMTIRPYPETPRSLNPSFFNFCRGDLLTATSSCPVAYLPTELCAN